MIYKTPEQWLKELNVEADPSKVDRFMDAQQWLDQKYSDKQQVKEIFHHNGIEKLLIGELVINDFPKLEKISFVCSGDLLKIEIFNCPRLGDLECVGSPIKEMDFGDSNKLERIYIPDNLLENIKLPANPSGLVRLYVHNNKLSSWILEILAPFTRYLPIGGVAYYEYSAKDKEKLKNILSKQKSQTTEISSFSTINQTQSKTESEKKNLTQLEKEYTFYKKFFDNYLLNKITELTELKSKLDKEENSRLNDYLQLKQSDDKSKNREKRLRKNLLKNLTSEELRKILDIDKEINELIKQVNEIELEAKFEVLESRDHGTIPNYLFK
ncbi:hypothetical protein RclHR1_00290005 [Rhizophagus clarus]|uniref:Uncharacterized protein n=1 Tax=Rhizophagus clarus TaxID=94130 RepID=A0A2Z6R3N7_9GLOM|nr:hypothetical protein RclHR1_00290005 [Rhizophagus clarus]GET02071.1 hypothetical protein RCL_jg15681.t1 [Rhizophagus clarus]